MNPDQEHRFKQLKAAHESGLIDDDTYQAAIAALGAAPSTGSVTNAGQVHGSVNTGSITAEVFIGGNLVQIFNSHAQQAKDALSAYLRRLMLDIGTLRLSAINTKQLNQSLEQFGLREVYVDLNTTLAIPESAKSLKAYLSKPTRRKPTAEDLDTDRKTRPVAVLEALGHHQVLTLLGAPGSGKSTFGALVLLTLAQDQLDALGPAWTHGALFPIRIVLRRMAESLPADLKQGTAGHIWKYLADDCDRLGLGPECAEYLRQFAAKRGCFFLFDGVDECVIWRKKSSR